MNKIMNKFVLAILAASFLFSSGCDELNNLPLNIESNPIYFSSTGNNNFSFDENSFCLSESDEWSENADDIESVQFVSAAFWVDAGTTPGLTGDIQVIVRAADVFGNPVGLPIIDWAMTGLDATDYPDSTSAFPITLSPTEIDDMNAYLATYKNGDDICFYASLTSSNLTGGPPYTLNAYVKFVIEAVVKL